MELLTPEQVAEKLQLKPATILRWAHAGKLPMIVLGQRTIRFHASAIESIVKKCQRPTGPATS